MKKNPNETIEGLNSAKGFIRKEIGRELNLRYTPEPIFKLDESIKNGIYISSLINEVNKGIEDDKDDENDEDEE